MSSDSPVLSGMGIISLGLLALALYAARLAWLASASRRWPTAPGRMLYAAAHLGRGKGPIGTYVHYTYTVDGTAYESKRLRFGLFPSPGYHLARSELSILQGAGRLRVYYDPKKPSRSCLLTGVNELTYTMPVLLLVLSAVFMAADVYLATLAQ